VGTTGETEERLAWLDDSRDLSLGSGASGRGLPEGVVAAATSGFKPDRELSTNTVVSLAASSGAGDCACIDGQEK
jgi:hypothetical protein